MRFLSLTLALASVFVASARAGEVVLFDASTADARAVRAQDGATFGIADGVLRVETRPSTGYPGVAVSGKWDLSACDKIEVEIVDGGIWGSYTLRLLNTGGSPHGKGCYISKLPVRDEKRIVCSQPLPVPLPNWGEVLAKLTRVRTWALPSLIWGGDGTGAVWNSKDHGVKVATLDPKDVREVAVYINTPKLAHKWGVKRIVAKGMAPDPGSVPAFARMTAKEFFPCIDGYGQFKHREWPDKTHSDADLACQREKEARDLAAHPGPAGWDKWGGWAAGPQLEATGSFYTTKRDGKWWIVDPDGRLWWSHGPVRVTPSGGITAADGHEDWFERLPGKDDPEALFYTTKDELLHPYYALHGLHRTYDFSAQNIRRKYGENWFAIWAELAHRRLRSWSCNTIANSSDRRICLMDKTPYTERFEIHAKPLRGHKGGWWTFSDPFDADFRAEARRMTEVYRAEFDDPWCIGFFVDNEQKWGDETTMALSTLKSPADQAAKVEFVRRLKEKYGEIAKLNAAWQADYESWPALLAAQMPPKVIAGSREDLKAFTRAVADAYFRIISEEIKRANPRKLYLGCRWAGWAPDFVVQAAAKHCDILSYNVYRKEMSGFSLPKGIDRPVLIGEFHFGALDRGPFCPGLILLKDQTERAETYRRYVRTSLEHPNIVGVHWHQFSDQSTAGRFDGENMQVGWTDVCDTPYWETIEAVRDIGSRLYEIRGRGVTQFDVRDFGAIGDGVTKDTEAVQRAIDACVASGGGRVVITNGTFLVAPITLGCGVELHLARGAGLLGSRDLTDYPNRSGIRHVRTDALPRKRNCSLVFAEECDGISITGEGFIDANGAHFVKPKSGDDWTGWHFERNVDLDKSLPRVVFFTGCRNVRIEGMTLKNPPAGWSFWIHDCDDVLFDGVQVKADVRYPNNDGIHINSCRDVVVRNCDLETGDDSIVVRANNRSLRENRVCERVVVSNCVCRSWSAGIRIAWSNDGTIRNCSFSDIRMRDTSVGIALALPGIPEWNKYDYGREATLVEDLVFEDIEMDGIYGRPILMWMSPRPDSRVEAVRRISFRDIRSTGLEKPLFMGLEGKPFEDISFKDCEFTVVGDDVLPGYRRHGAAAWDRYVGSCSRHCKVVSD